MYKTFALTADVFFDKTHDCSPVVHVVFRHELTQTNDMKQQQCFSDRSGAGTLVKWRLEGTACDPSCTRAGETVMEEAGF